MRHLKLKHTHILDMSCGVRMVVKNNKEILNWDEWFGENPDARDKLKAFLVDSLLGFLPEKGKIDP